jgi:hypothetical protein
MGAENSVYNSVATIRGPRYRRAFQARRSDVTPLYVNFTVPARNRSGSWPAAVHFSKTVRIRDAICAGMPPLRSQAVSSISLTATSIASSRFRNGGTGAGGTEISRYSKATNQVNHALQDLNRSQTCSLRCARLPGLKSFGPKFSSSRAFVAKSWALQDLNPRQPGPKPGTLSKLS